MKANISAARDGFRRAGREWNTTPAPVDLGEFTAEQLEQLRADPAITIADADGNPIPATEEQTQGQIRADALEQLAEVFTDKQLAELVEIGRSLEPEQIDKALRTPPAATAKQVAGMRARLIYLAVRALPASTKDGKASVAAVREATELDDVSAAERDEAHAQVERDQAAEAERAKAAQAEAEKAAQAGAGEGAPQGD